MAGWPLSDTILGFIVKLNGMIIIKQASSEQINFIQNYNQPGGKAALSSHCTFGSTFLQSDALILLSQFVGENSGGDLWLEYIYEL